MVMHAILTNSQFPGFFPFSFLISYLFYNILVSSEMEVLKRGRIRKSREKDG
jgi:hypothetical protein